MLIVFKNIAFMYFKNCLHTGNCVLVLNAYSDVLSTGMQIYFFLSAAAK